MLGGGICGLATALMLARDGHDVTVLERDGDPVPDAPEAAWEGWQRNGVVQFRQAHFLQSRGRQVLDEELPDVTRALEAAGAMRLDPISRMPPTIADRAARPGDERFVTWTGRRTTLELAVARIAEAELDVRRGVTVTGVEPGSVHTDRARLAADLVVDAMGRRSALPKLLGTPVPEEAEDCGFLYYTRFFRGTLPELRGAPLTPLGTFSVLALPGDAGTWSVTLFASARDQPLKAAARGVALDGARPRLPAARALARRRADHRRDGDGRRDRPLSLAGAGARARERGRRVGVHESVAGPRHRARAGARRAPAPDRTRARRRSGRTRSPRRPSAS